MLFASSYFEKNQVYPFQIPNRFDHLDFCIIIPVYNEPQLVKTLESISRCTSGNQKWAVIICINSNDQSPQQVLLQNEKTVKEIQSWTKSKQTSTLHFFSIHHKDIPYKYRGAGMARKLAMDEAIHLFHEADNPNGIIVSLDADAEVEPNFIVEIEKFYMENPKMLGATHYFEHPLEGNVFPEAQYEAIVNYELYLRYFNQAMRFTGFPYAYHTVGSCFSVRAKTYIAQGGMNRQHAGEDFYFIQKVASLGNFGEINSTTVYPSPRVSDRVPFGTGPEIEHILHAKTKKYPVYNVQAFKDLKNCFHKLSILFKKESDSIDQIYIELAAPLREFISQQELKTKINEINANTASDKSFVKRLFQWFNAFKIVKFLNYTHDKKLYSRHDVYEASIKLLQLMRQDTKANSKKEMLEEFRHLDRTGYYHFNLLQQ